MSKSESERPRLAVTPGEPAGVGPDIALAAARSIEGADLLVVADPDMLDARARLLGLDVSINDWGATRRFEPDAINVYPVPLGSETRAGTLDVANAPYVLQTLEEAVRLCEQDICQGLVTGPVHKAVINEAGFPFSGHTEWLAERTQTAKVVMLLATDGLMVALATTHLPLRAVADAITGESLAATIRVLNDALIRRFDIERPRILVLGLNPHAGESGHLGHEETDTIEPVLSALQSEGIGLTGPVPADTAFSPKLLAAHDVVLAMYHDQGLPVLKFKGFGNAANITLGLPIIRTSVDHGTAIDIAGTGTADPGSFHTAIRYAITMARAG